MTYKFIITGAPGVGKTALIEEMKRRHYPVYPEPARVVLNARHQSGGSIVPGLDPAEFLAEMLKLLKKAYQLAGESSGPHLFDRGIPDLFAYAQDFKTELPALSEYAQSHRYEKVVFLLEPWNEIFVNDDLRTLSYSDTENFHEWIIEAYEKAGYRLVIVPKTTVEERADFVRAQVYRSIVEEFEFLDCSIDTDDELSLCLVEKFEGSIERERVPAYIYDMVHCLTGETMGRINLRVGSTPELKMYRGEIGYSVQESFRGKRYAARSIKLLVKLAQAHGFKELWITCNPDNAASRRTLEFAGAKLIEVIDLPEGEKKFHDGAPQKCRYKLII
jgi:predicted ATPase/predicted acetyltransferase